MTTTFSEGLIPPSYREIFEACSNNGDPIDKDVYETLLKQFDLEPNQASFIWNLAGPPQGNVLQTNLYKTLALAAWAQSGKHLSEKLFDTCIGKEYPVPSIKDLQAVRNLKTAMKSNRSILGYTYSDLTKMDSISVSLVPEKKGLFLKYSEYSLTSKKFSSNVTRRYNDFSAFNDLLISRFPYRMVPRLPPKKIVSDSHFLEVRRRALQRWLTLICRHPTISGDPIVSFFLTDKGSDFQTRMKEVFRRVPDEFMTSDVAANSRNLLPSESEEIASRDQIRTLVNVVDRLKTLVEEGIDRQTNYSKDSKDFASQLKTLSDLNIGPLGSKWGCMQKGFSLISSEMQTISVQSQHQAGAEQISVGEHLALLFDVLVSYRDLCERLEKGLVNDHQAALAKMLTLKKRKLQGAIRGADSDSVEKLEEKMLAQENVISNMELRSDFSLYCIHMEVQLVYAYLETFSPILHNYVSLQMGYHSEMTAIWKQLMPKVQQFLPMNSSPLNDKI